jgi:hypothetical protein
MDIFEEFMNNVLKRVVLSTVEEYCKSVFSNVFLNTIQIQQGDSLNYSINLYEILEKTYKILLKDKTRIVCLIFSNSTMIYVNKYTLLHIEFFNNYFTDNNGDDDSVIIEMELTGVIDDYDVMEDVINFCKEGGLCINTYDYERLYKLAKVNQYLLSVHYEKKVVFHNSVLYHGIHRNGNGIPLLFATLTEFIRSLIYEMLVGISDKCPLDFEYKENCFDMITEMYKMTYGEYIIYAKKSGIFYKYREEFEKSSLYTSVQFITNFD